MSNNNIPKGWKETTLGIVVDKMYSGGTPSTKRDDYYNGNIPWIRTQEVTFNRINKADIQITELGLKNSSAKYIPIDTVIVAMYGNSAGRVAISKIEATTNQACCNIVSKATVSNAEYIYYNLLNRYVEIKGKANGAAQQNLSVGVLKDLDICLAPLLEQQAIASMLTTFDDKIELLQAQNETLEATAQTIFKEWFGKYQVGDELPEGWRVGKLEEVIEFINGFGFKSKELLPEPESDCLKVFKMGDIKKGGGFNQNKTKSYYKREDALKIPKYILKSGDLLMSMTDMKDAISLLGHTALMIYDNEYIVNQRVGLIRASNDINIEYPFLYLLTNNDVFIANLRGRANSGVQVNLTTKSIKESSLVIPDKNTNTKFNMLVKPLFEKMKHNEIQIQTLQQTRDTLLPKLMSGKLRVEEFRE